MRTIYNRYIPSGAFYEPIEEETPPHRPAQAKHNPEHQEHGNRPVSPLKGAGFLDGVTGKLGGLLKGFRLEELDSGDILLVLILLFLFLESDDNLELVITLGLLLLFGLFGKEDNKESEESCAESEE